MLIQLVALVAVPAVALVASAAVFTGRARAEALVAQDVGRAMRRVEQIEQVRGAIYAEAMATGLSAVASRIGLTLEQVEEIIRTEAVPLAEARREMDRRLAAVVPDQRTKPLLDDLRIRLARVRSSVDATATAPATTTSPAAGDDGDDGDDGWRTYLGFRELYGVISDLQQVAVRPVIRGGTGVGSPRLLEAAALLETTTRVVELANGQASYIEGLYHAPTIEDRAQVLNDLRGTMVAFRREAAQLPDELSGDLAASWNEMMVDPEMVGFQAFIVGVSKLDPAADVDASMVGVRDGARQAVHLSTTMRSFLAEVVEQGVAVAEADERAAEARARWTLLICVLLLGITVALVLVIGGRLRRHLQDLARGAERFSSGRLEPIPVRGPRELAIACEALNDAVANFERVAVQAEILASGELDAPALQEPAPGALGRAVHASVARIVDTVRERELLRQELAHEAAHDPLTGLPNRAEAERLLGAALARAERAGTRIAVLFVDLDRFKRCNDRHGHAAGDHVLRTAAIRMEAQVRPGDTVCRLGGDEFVIIVEPVQDDHGVVEIGERIAAALAEPITYAGRTIVVGGSVGVAVSGGEIDVDGLLRAADRAMYRAKSRSGGGVELVAERSGDEVLGDDVRTAPGRAPAGEELPGPPAAGPSSGSPGPPPPSSPPPSAVPVAGPVPAATTRSQPV